MRTTILLLAVAAFAVAVLAACRAGDDGAADSAADDTTRADDTTSRTDTTSTIDTIATDSAAVAAATRRKPPAPSRLPIRRAADTAADSVLPPDDSVRALRPNMPQVTPEKRPRTWRGFKLPEETPVRAPVETIRRVEQAPDSVMKGDSTKPLRPER